MKVDVRAAQYRKKIDTINAQESDAITFSLALGCQFCRILRNFGRRRLNALVRGTYEELADHFVQYREREDEVFSRDNVPILYTGLRNQVRALEVDVDAIEREFAFPPSPERWMSARDREKRKTRLLLMGDREKMFRSFWYAMMLYLWRTYGWGRDRLTRFYVFCRRRYREIWGEYLACRPEKDETVRESVARSIALVEGLGVSF